MIDLDHAPTPVATGSHLRTLRDREAWLAALANLGGSGIGHVYSGRLGGGVVMAGGGVVVLFLVAAAAAWLPPSPLVAFLLWFLVLGYTGLTLVLGWRAGARAPRPYVARWYNRWYWYLAYALLFLTIVPGYALPWIHTHVAQAFRVPSGSMEPTVLIGDFLEVPRIGPGIGPIERGAIVVLTSVEEPGLKLIKRVAGIAGDTLAMHDGILLRNGKPVSEPYVRRESVPRHESPTERAKMRAWQVEHFAGPVPDGYSPDLSEWGPVTVPAGMLFLLGDNRESSYDSRYYGFVPATNVVGRPRLVYWSYDPPIGLGRIRWSRIGRPLE